jgi:hypothetical protein
VSENFAISEMIFHIHPDVVVPSNMNPVGEEGNIFAALFDKVPARRPAVNGDIAGTVLYLCSEAGVSFSYGLE